MSGNTHASGEGYKDELKLLYANHKEAIEKELPNEELLLAEDYTTHVIKGHRLKLTLYLKNKQTGKKQIIYTHYVQIPKHIPKWITKHKLWHHTKEELNILQKLMDSKQEKYPSINTREHWLQILKDNHVLTTVNAQKHIPKIQ